MKKQYDMPTMKVIKIQTVGMLADSPVNSLGRGSTPVVSFSSSEEDTGGVLEAD